MGKPLNPAVWALAAEDILAVLTTEEYFTSTPNHWDLGMHEMGMSAMFFPPGKHHDFYMAVSALYLEDRPINGTTIAEKNFGIDPGWAAGIIVHGAKNPTLRGKVFQDNLRICQRHSEAMQAKHVLGTGQSRLDNGEDLEKVIETVVKDLSSTGGQQIEGETAVGAAKAMVEFLADVRPKGVSTGIDFLDETENDIIPGQYMLLAGPYKSGKTRVMLNMAISALDQGESVGILSFENLKVMTTASIVVMLAMRKLIDQFGYDPNNRRFWFSVKELVKMRSQFRTVLHPDAVRAIDAALAEFAAYGDRLTIYDSSKEGGALSTSESLQRVIRRDRQLYGKWLYFVDHLLLIDRHINEDFDRMSKVSGVVQRLTREDTNNPMTIVALAQLNEETIKGKSAGYSPGIKGGGAAAADCDVAITTHPIALDAEDGIYHNDRAMLAVKLSRWGGTGKREILWEPKSGVLHKQRTVDLSQF